MALDSACATESCERAATKAGLCERHYRQRRDASLGTCSLVGCTRKIKARDLCNQHYLVARAGGATCSVVGCAGLARTRGYCQVHYYRWHKTGDPGEPGLRRKPPRNCKVNDCANPAIGRHDLCRSHADRLQAYGSVEGRLCACGARALNGVTRCREHYIAEMTRQIGLGKRPALSGRRGPVGSGSRNGQGYVQFKVADVVILEHRAVMERLIGRPLYRFENVHHKNGIRHDNDPSNLELWVKPQPSGQRPEDLVSWVAHYYPNLVEAELKARKKELRTGQARLIV